MTRELAVEAGRVQCPESGSVDVEHCLTCRSFRAIAGGVAAPVVECRPPAAPMPALWDSVATWTGHLPG